MEKFTRKYGLGTAVCLVVGTVIGSGLFFKAQNVLLATGGNTSLGVAAWVITGILMILCSAQFAVMATKYEKVSGMVDYAEATCGSGFAYYLAWFASTIYLPAMTSVLAWVSARYFGSLLGWDITGPEVLTLSGFFLVGSYTLNALSPKMAGKFQISTTVIKMIPIVLMAVVGIVVGLLNGTLGDNFTAIPMDVISNSNGGLFPAIVATVFAYEGWIVATSINAELKDPKKNLPIALVIGSFIVVLAYVAYYIGVSGGASSEELMAQGTTVAFTNLFGSLGGTVLCVFVVISCLGTLNGLMVAVTRSMYSIAARGEGPAPHVFNQIDKATNMATNSSVWGLFLCALWLLYFYGANLTSGWFGLFNFDSSELPIVTLYAFYIPILIAWMKKEKELSVFKRFILPILSLCACGFIVLSAVYAHGILPFRSARDGGTFAFPVLFYLIVFLVIMGIGGLLRRPRARKSTQD